MPTYADFGGWVISTIAGWFVVTADTLFLSRLYLRQDVPRAGQYQLQPSR